MATDSNHAAQNTQSKRFQFLWPEVLNYVPMVPFSLFINNSLRSLHPLHSIRSLIYHKNKSNETSVFLYGGKGEMRKYWIGVLFQIKRELNHFASIYSLHFGKKKKNTHAHAQTRDQLRWKFEFRIYVNRLFRMFTQRHLSRFSVTSRTWVSQRFTLLTQISWMRDHQIGFIFWLLQLCLLCAKKKEMMNQFEINEWINEMKMKLLVYADKRWYYTIDIPDPYSSTNCRTSIPDRISGIWIRQSIAPIPGTVFSESLKSQLKSKLFWKSTSPESNRIDKFTCGILYAFCSERRLIQTIESNWSKLCQVIALRPIAQHLYTGWLTHIHAWCIQTAINKWLLCR